MKTTTPLFAATLLLAAIATCAQADISVVAPVTNANVGAPLSAPISMSNVVDLYAWQFDLSFDPTILQLTSIQEGPLLGSGGPTVFIPGTIDNTAGTAIFTLDTLVGPVPGVSTNNGIAVFFNFDPINTGTSPLDLSNVVLLDSSLNDIPFTVTNGSVDVAAVPEPSIPRWAMGVAIAGLILIQRRIAARKRAA